MGERWHVEVDHGLCIGSGMCVSTAPGRFRLDPGRQSCPVTPEDTPSESVLAAAEGCPVEAISIVLADSRKAVFPPEE